MVAVPFAAPMSASKAALAAMSDAARLEPEQRLDPVQTVVRAVVEATLNPRLNTHYVAGNESGCGPCRAKACWPSEVGVLSPHRRHAADVLA